MIVAVSKNSSTPAMIIDISEDRITL